MKKIYTALVALGLALGANAQTTFKLDSSFNGNGIFSTNGSAGNNANAFAVGGILNTDGSVWLAGGLNGVGNSSWAHFISRRKANGSADSSFGVNGAYGYQTTSWVTMGFLTDIFPVKNGGAYATHTGYGGYYAASPTAAAVTKETYDDADGTAIKASAQINDSVIVQLGSNNIYTYKGLGSNIYQGANWFNNGSTYYGPLPLNNISLLVTTTDGVLTQSNQKVLVYGWRDSSNYFVPFILRLKKNSYSELDSTFGTNGVSYAARGVFAFDKITAAYVQNDDKIILHNGEYFMRLNADGSYDNTFANGNGYMRVDVATGSTSIYANAYKFITNATNTELYGITRNFSGDNMVFGAYTNGNKMNSFHAGKNYYRKLDADINFISFLEFNDISINNGGDLLVTGRGIKAPGGVYELFAMKLKKGVCNTINITPLAINDTTVKITVSGIAAFPLTGVYYDGGDAEFIIFSSNNIGNITVKPGTTYTINIVDANGCENSFVYSTAPLSVNSYKNIALSIYPNPASTSLHIGNLLLGNNATAIITSIDGKIIENRTIHANTLDISALQKGIYFIQIKDEAQQYSTRFIKQ
jgi:hypothetical protein